MVDPVGRNVDDPVRELEHFRMADLERRRIIHLRDLLLHGFDDARAGVPGVAAPKTGGPVQHLAAVRGRVVHAFRPDEHARR